MPAADFAAGVLAVAVFALGDRLAVDFAAGVFVVFAAVAVGADVFFFGDRLAVALAAVVAAGCFAAAGFFFGDRVAVALAVALPAGFFAGDFVDVVFFVAIYVAPLLRRLFSFRFFLGRRARKNFYGSALRSGEG